MKHRQLDRVGHGYREFLPISARRKSKHLTVPQRDGLHPKKVRDTISKFVIALCVALAATACKEDSSGLVCTDVACYAGLTVQVPAEASAPYTVKLRALNVPGPLTWTAECTAALGCGQLFRAHGFTAEKVEITVTWAGGTSTRSFTPEYKDVFENGPDCPSCKQATVAF
jgi:hypothetical protein